MTTVKDSYAGYQIRSLNPGPTILIQSKWTAPTVNCFVANPNTQFLGIDVQIDHLYNPDTGSELSISCSGGLATTYVIIYYLGAAAGSVLPPADTVSAGDQMQTVATLVISRGAVTIKITDITKAWVFSKSATETVNKMLSGYVTWRMSGSTALLPNFSTLKFSSDVVTLGGHHGSIGSFLAIPSDLITKYILVNATTHDTLARPSSISSTSTGFSVNWINSS